jgi:hypothetical protein
MNLLDSTSRMHSYEATDAWDKRYTVPGICQRLALATDVLTGLLKIAPYQVMTREELVAEAYRYADVLMANQHTDYS